ncbi:MAG: hypothetical protein Q9219_007492 [cf. Caloplaca sp. 3 TL-2023]
MVVFPPPCVPRVLNAYPNVPLSPSVLNLVTHDFNVGTLARFQNPSSLISIHDRPDLYSLSHFEMRQRLDAEGVDQEIIIIDSDTATNHAVWFVRSTFDSEMYTEGTWPPPKEYPGETPLWKLHMLTQHVPIEFDFEIGGGKSITEELSEPYDAHDPQIPPISHGPDYNTKEGALSNAWYSQITITAGPGEYEISDDPSARDLPQLFPAPPYVVRLTSEAAKGAGLLSEWDAWREPLPRPKENIKFSVHYDWDSPKWAWDGTVPGVEAKIERLRNSKGVPRVGCKTQAMRQNGLRLPFFGNGHALNHSVHATS